MMSCNKLLSACTFQLALTAVPTVFCLCEHQAQPPVLLTRNDLHAVLCYYAVL